MFGQEPRGQSCVAKILQKTVFSQAGEAAIP
jgi:hypothetical protein